MRFDLLQELADPRREPERVEVDLVALDVLDEALDEQLQGLRKEYRPQVILVLSNANDRIAALLTPEQLARFEKWKEQNRPLLEGLKRNP